MIKYLINFKILHFLSNDNSINELLIYLNNFGFSSTSK